MTLGLSGRLMILTLSLVILMLVAIIGNETALTAILAAAACVMTGVTVGVWIEESGCYE